MGYALLLHITVLACLPSPAQDSSGGDQVPFFPDFPLLGPACGYWVQREWLLA